MQTEFLMNFSLRKKRLEEPCKRSGHVAVHFNGYMLMWGGYKDERERRAGMRLEDRYMKGEEIWCLDVEAQRWQKWMCARNNPDGMSGSCAVSIGDSMYIIGGHRQDGNTNELYQFDVRTKSWTHLDPGGVWPSPRDKFICWPYEDKLVIFGGFGPPPDEDVKGEWIGDPSSVRFYDHGMEIRGWNNHIFVYNLKSNTWSQPDTQGVPPCPRAAHAGCVIGNRGYVFGGRNGDQRKGDIQYLDLDNMRWSGELNVQGDVPEGRSWHGMAACSDQHFMLYGGFTTNREALADVWVFDTLSERWTQLYDRTTQKPRLWHTVVPTHSPGEVIAFGGCTNNILDPEQNDIQTNLVETFYFSPKSLSRLTLESIVQHKDKLGQHIQVLPKSLISRIEEFLQGMLSSDGSPTHTYNLRSRRSEEYLEEPMEQR